MTPRQSTTVFMRALLATALAGLTGCVSVLPEATPPAPRYTVADIDPSQSFEGAAGFSLAIDDVLATRAIDTTKIAYVNDDGEYRYYNDAEWADRAPRLFMASLVRSFQNIDGLVGIGSRASQPIADYILQADLRAFEAHQDGSAATVTVSVYVRLTDVRGKAYGARRFTLDRPVAAASKAGNASATAQTLNDTTAAILGDIVDWSLGVIADSEQKKAGA